MYKRSTAKGRGLILLLLGIWAAISLLPLYWVFATSLQLDRYVESNPPKFFPYGPVEYLQHWQEARAAVAKGDTDRANEEYQAMRDTVTDTFSGYTTLFERTGMWRWFFNSTYISLLVIMGVLLFDTMAGYALAKRSFPGRDLFFWLILGTMMVPGQVTLAPLFILVRKLHLMDTHWALILPDLATAFGVFLMRQFIITIPSEFEEAARIDGASELEVFGRVILPLVRPALATLGIITFINVWNSFLWPIIVLNKSFLYTLPVGLKTLQDQNMAMFKLLMSGAAVAAIPVIVVFMAFQRNFVKGLTIGGLKG